MSYIFYKKSNILSYSPLVPLCRGRNLKFRYQYFCGFFLGTFSLFVQFLVFQSTIISYILFVIYFTILQFGIMCSLLILFYWTDKNTSRPPQHQWKWWQPPLPATWCISRFGQPIPSVPTYHPHHVRSIRSICTIDPIASQFLSFYQPAHKNKVYLSKPEQTVTMIDIPWQKTGNKWLHRVRVMVYQGHGSGRGSGDQWDWAPQIW